MSPHYETPAPVTHTLGPGRSKCGISKFGADLVLGHRVVSAPFSPRPLINHGESFCRATCKPPLKQMAVRSERCFVTASHLPVPQCQSIRRGREPRESLSFLSAPSFTRGACCKPPKPLATARVRAAQHSRVASAPKRISVAARAVSKGCVLLAPQSHSR
jgi:hypothetical protein